MLVPRGIDVWRTIWGVRVCPIMDKKIILVGHFGVRYEGARPNLVDGEIMHIMVHKDKSRKIRSEAKPKTLLPGEHSP